MHLIADTASGRRGRPTPPAEAHRAMAPLLGTDGSKSGFGGLGERVAVLGVGSHSAPQAAMDSQLVTQPVWE